MKLFPKSVSPLKIKCGILKIKCKLNNKKLKKDMNRFKRWLFFYTILHPIKTYRRKIFFKKLTKLFSNPYYKYLFLNNSIFKRNK